MALRSAAIRHAPGGGLEVLGRMPGIARRREDDRDGRISEHPFDEELRCALAAELSGNWRQRVSCGAIDHRAFRERAIDQHGDAKLAGKRQQARPRLRFRQRIIDLQEIRLLAPDHALELRMSAREVMRHADVPERAGIARSPQGRQVRVEIQEIVDLHEIERLRAQEPMRVRELRLSGGAPGGPDLGREERPRGRLDRSQDVANPLLGAAVHRRAVDDAASGAEEAPHGSQRGVEVRTAGRHVQHLPGSEAERGQLFARTRNRALDRISGSGSHARCSEAREQCKRFAPRQSQRRFLPFLHGGLRSSLLGSTCVVSGSAGLTMLERPAERQG